MNCRYKIHPKKIMIKKSKPAEFAKPKPAEFAESKPAEFAKPKPAEFAESKPAEPKKSKPVELNNFEGLLVMRKYYGDSHRNVYYATDKYHKEYVTKSVFSEFWQGTSKDGVLTFPNGNIILTNIRFESLEDIDLVESIELNITSNIYTEVIPTSIFPQLREFYKMRDNQLPFFLFKYGLPLCEQECTLRFNFKENVEKREISIVVNININYNSKTESFLTPTYLVKEIEFEKDKELYLQSCPYFFIPEERIDDIQLMVDKNIVNLEYDDDKKIVPLVKNPTLDLYWNYMLNFKRVDRTSMKFTPDRKMKLYFVCYNEYMFENGYGGYRYSM